MLGRPSSPRIPTATVPLRHSQHIHAFVHGLHSVIRFGLHLLMHSLTRLGYPFLPSSWPFSARSISIADPRAEGGTGDGPAKFTPIVAGADGETYGTLPFHVTVIPSSLQLVV